VMSEPKIPASKIGLSRHEDGSLKLDGQSLLASLGGVWGILESAIPGASYVLTFAISGNVVLAISIAVSLALAFIIGQIVRKRPLTQAISGLVGIAIAAFLTLRGGGDASHARDFYLQGLFTNLAYFCVVSVSILIRWPIIGVIVGAFTSGTKWRKDKSLVRRYSMITLLWVALFGTRLAVEVPLYLANAVVPLGVAKLALGIPFYALVVWFTWLAVRPLIRRAE
jgi:hypothetical protein